MSFDPIERWHEAVELGSRGYAAAARSALAELAADPNTPAAVAALTYSTRASLLRQAGAHGLARGGDGRACALVVDHSGGWAVTAWLDGLIGLAADNLGIGDFAQSRRLLDRAAADLTAAESTTAVRGTASADIAADWRALPRVALRLAWVGAEWGLYSGDLDAAGEAAEDAAAQARSLPSPRHLVKTRLIGAATAAAAGNLAEAAAEAAAAHADAGELGLLPLQWAAAALLAAIPGHDLYQREVPELRARLARRGMLLLPLGPGERLASIW